MCSVTRHDRRKETHRHNEENQQGVDGPASPPACCGVEEGTVLYCISYWATTQATDPIRSEEEGSEAPIVGLAVLCMTVPSTFYRA